MKDGTPEQCGYLLALPLRLELCHIPQHHLTINAALTSFEMPIHHKELGGENGSGLNKISFILNCIKSKEGYGSAHGLVGNNGLIFP